MQTNLSTADTASRDFSTISPSAYSILMMKGLTPIPYAHPAAQLLLASRPDNADPLGASIVNPLDPDQRPPLFWARLLHFENRYWNIDQLMQSLPITNILEISSGFSFRGLALSQQKPVFYIDTDLPDLIATKQQFVTALTRESAAADQAPAAKAPATNIPETPTATKPSPETSHPGHYQLLPLNVLDAPAFQAIVDRFPPGELLIVNEGLLMYLDLAEKEILCHTIHDILERRGGYWITGDIYIQKELDPSLADREDPFNQFLRQHHIEEKKFADFESAAEFFTRMGFTVDREAIIDVNKLSAWPRLLAAISPETQKKLMQQPRIHATWRLRVTAAS